MLNLYIDKTKRKYFVCKWLPVKKPNHKFLEIKTQTASCKLVVGVCSEKKILRKTTKRFSLKNILRQKLLSSVN